MASVDSVAIRFRSVQWTTKCAIAGLFALALAVVLYAVARADGSAYLVPIQLSQILPAIESGAALGSLPAFLHVFAFTLLTITAARPGSVVACVAIGCGWFLVNVLFEAGQHPDIAPVIDSVLPASFVAAPLLENVGPYFSHGTFDPLDILAAALGTAAAIGFIFLVRQRESES